MNNNQKGQSLVEILIAVAIFTLVVSFLTFLILDSFYAERNAREITQATFLAQEGLEAVKSIRDNNWQDLIAGAHGLAIVSDNWVLQGNDEDVSAYLNNGKRQIIIENIDNYGSFTKKINSKISWNNNSSDLQELSFINYLTSWTGEWDNPSIANEYNFSGNQNGSKIQIQDNLAYLIRTGGNPDFVIIDISDPANFNIVKELALPGTPEDISVAGDYAYIASRHNSQEMQIIDISNPALANQVGSFDALGSNNGRSVFAVDTTVYLVRSNSNTAGQDELFIINASAPSAPIGLGSLNLSSAARGIVVIDDYAYVASQRNSQELQIINISNPASLSIEASLNLSGNSNAISIVGFENTVVLGRINGYIHLVDVSNPLTPAEYGLYFDAQEDVNDLALGNNNNYLFVANDVNSAEFQLVDISSPSTPTLISSYNFSTIAADNIEGLAYNQNNSPVYAVTASNTAEFIIIAPQ